MAPRRPRPVPARNNRARHTGRRRYPLRIDQARWFRGWRRRVGRDLRPPIAVDPSLNGLESSMETMPATIPGVTRSEATLSGRSISPGLGMGRAWIVGDVLKWTGPPEPIDPNDVDGELVRLAHSCEKSLAELEQH